VAEGMPRSVSGKRIVITRATAQCERLARELLERGAIPVVLPLVSFADPGDLAPLDSAITDIERYDWLILTSAQAVRAVTQRSAELERPLMRKGSKLRIAAVGPVTAAAARLAGFSVEHIAKTHNGVALANELGERLRGANVFLPRSDRANPDLPAALKLHGAHVTEVIAYQTLRPAEVDQDSLRKVAEGEADAVLFFSPSAVQHFTELFGVGQLRTLQDKLALTAVGPVTAKALREAGALKIVIAADTTAASVVKTLEEHFAGIAKAAPAGEKRG
jgi:uroporphyrinogen-III synthase